MGQGEGRGDRVAEGAGRGVNCGSRSPDPLSLEVPLGKRQRVVAEVTNDEGERATDVYLTWAHDADDPMIVRIRTMNQARG